MRRMLKLSVIAFVILAALLVQPRGAAAATVQMAAPSLDRWMYPFNATPGTRPAGSIFGAFGNPAFDNRDAEILLGYDTAGQGVPTGLPAAQYQVTSLTLTATVNSNQTFNYDPSYDAYTSYLASGDPSFTPDADAGRPLELYGAGFRGGYTSLEFAAVAGPPGFAEGEAFGDFGPTPFAPDKRDRAVFPIDLATGLPRDVSNNVDDAFDASPLAVGQAAIAPGALVPANTTFTFDIDLSDPHVLAFVQDGLAAGQLEFVLTSLSEAAFGGAPTFPSFFFRENLVGGPAATLELVYTIGTGNVAVMPEPASALLLLLGVGGVAVRRRRRMKAA